jgi:2-dehydro-3-deoxyphosphooctonate aldolase (KDO 8-P synthase)
MFGYQDMIVDFRNSNHATLRIDGAGCNTLLQQQPTAGVTGGRPDMIETIAKAGIAVGVDGILSKPI